ncbi:MAG: hypothetical protein QNJ72_03940 [Pleurocapsa sp. MO_226.B13]|nr:hypothetical protein [Pleurocapsa sp. MO_226.B13]
MSKQQLKLLARTTPEKSRHDKPLVHIERKLTQEQLEAIAAGIIAMN